MEQKKPAITIITVVYNAAVHLENTIINVSGLEYDNLQYIVVDGGSADETLTVIKKYPAVVDKWVSEPDKGIYDAMNKGWEMANPDSYILFLGAGDLVYSLPATLSHDYSRIYYGNVFIGTKIFKSTRNFKLRLGNTIHHQALLVPKKVHPAPPFDLKFKVYADFDFNQRLLKKKIPFEYSESFKSYALPDGLSAKKDDREMLSVVKKNFGFLTSLLAYCFYALQKLKKN